MDPLEYLRVADLWVQGASEAEWRSAVSRAYYAAFHVARHLLLSCQFRVPQGERAHAYVWLRLGAGEEPRGSALPHATRLRPELGAGRRLAATVMRLFQ
jgi:hypothetical protein